jgi:hypothetical protein
MNLAIKTKITTMKKNIFLSLAIGLILGLSSCSKCYECTQLIEIQMPDGSIKTEESTEEYCTASEEELKAKEDNGFKCSSSV